MNVGKVNVKRELDKLNPNRDPMDSATDTLGYALNLENYKIGKELGYEANYESAEDRAKISSKISVLVNKSNYYLYKKVKRDIKVLLDTIEF